MAGSVLVTGASRGLGLEFARQYADEGWRVYATCRDVTRPGGLASLKGDIIVLPLEVTEKRSIDALVQSFGSAPLDILIANAGVIGPRGMTADNVDRVSWLETFAVNAVAPIAIVGALKRNTEKGKHKKLVAVSSRMGSIGGNVSGGSYAYRSSKAALNAAWHSLALDLAAQGYAMAVLHPGWVKTDMGGKDADIDPVESVTGMRQVIDRLTVAETGRFYNYDGAELPW
ncbi:short-chain dehydrogenase [Aliidongia dinghuensis]|uniref:Short-chain dehydrogenase n=1 Tax=Aliidongia dinghuensis TaxID=1867774 RepID=A0A8J2YWA3_9PROT|nr:SDR family oxidoreductase [Aliidongia dinghuensis]GGF31414.1 short-chain dehydrogenase [Aliidongia dinghuensis]